MNRIQDPHLPFGKVPAEIATASYAITWVNCRLQVFRKIDNLVFLNSSVALPKILVVLVASCLMWAGVLFAAILGLDSHGLSMLWILLGAVACSLLFWVFVIAFGQSRA